jgi:hypothetical protein
VFPADTPEEFVTDHLATWSLVVRDGTYFAVSAAHCALLLGGSADYTFVPLPLTVLRCGVVSVRFFVSPASKNEFSVNSIKRQCNFVAVELREAPIPAVVLEAVTWPTTLLPSENIAGCSVVGLTSTHTVSGSNAVPCPTNDGNDCVKFYSTHEGTNSGALLYRPDAVTNSPPAFLHLAAGDGGEGATAKRSYMCAIEFPTSVPTVQFTPIIGNNQKLTW